MSSGTVPSRDPDAPLAVVRGRQVGRRGGREIEAARNGRRVVIVLGMHRSGTSLLSNLLHYLGVDMADTSDRASKRNAGGFWERPALNDLQDEVLEAIGRPIASPEHCLPFPPAWWRRKEVQAIKPRLVDFVAGELDKSSNLWGFKDPRTCRLLPLWWEIFRELDLTPIYIHAIRSPAESAISMSLKSGLRAISATQGELMWIAYNYDVLRYVALEHPTLTVKYDDWFADGAAVARRLADALGIGVDLSDEDLRECVESVVKPDVRNHVAGTRDAVSRMPIAGLLYDALLADQRESIAGNRALKNQMSFIGLLMKSTAPIIGELVPLVHLRDSTVQSDAGHRTLGVSGDDGITARLREIEGLLHGIAEDGAIPARPADIETRPGQVADGEAIGARLVRIEAELGRPADGGSLAARLDVIDASLGDLAGREGTEARLDGLAMQLARLVDGAAAVEHDAALRSEAERLRADVARISSLLVARTRRARAILAAARRDRAAAIAQHGRADRAAEESRNSVDRLAVERVRSRRLALALAARDERIADLETRLAAAPNTVETSEGLLAWPSDGRGAALAGDYGFAGGIDRVDRNGVAGWVRFAERPELVPIVELAIDGAFVLAQACVPSGGRHVFAIDWHDVPTEHAGRTATIRVAGIERAIDGPELTVPARQRHLHQLPAHLAAELFGGSVAQAEAYEAWLAAYGEDGALDAAREWLAARDTAWPLVSVAIFGGDAGAMAVTLEALRAQVYPYWEALCIDGAATLEALDPRVRVVSASASLRIVAAGDLVSFVEAGDLIARTGLLHLAAAAERSPGFALIYSDEDRIDTLSGARGAPYMKGGWSDDLALVQDYASRLALVRRERLSGEDGPLDRAQVRRIVTALASAEPAAVVHLPFVLYHRAMEPDPAPDPAPIVAALGERLPARFAGARVEQGGPNGVRLRWPLPDPPPRVSLVVPTRDRIDLLRVCLDGVLNGTDYPDVEVLIADNGSVEPETHAYFATLSSDPRVRIIPCPGPFDFSEINNKAATEATGSVIGLINNDLAIVRPDWLRLMVENVLRSDIGVVGAKLLYADGTVQHAGIVLGIGTASHLYRGFPGDADVQGDRLRLTQDVTAVTAACLIIRYDVWQEIDGFDCDFPIAYNDVDLCLKVLERGYRILWNADAVVLHLESQSRGKEEGEKRERLVADQKRLIERWGDKIAHDPYYSPNLAVTHVDARSAFPPRVSAPWGRPADGSD